MPKIKVMKFNLTLNRRANQSKNPVLLYKSQYIIQNTNKMKK